MIIVLEKDPFVLCTFYISSMAGDMENNYASILLASALLGPNRAKQEHSIAGNCFPY